MISTPRKACAAAQKGVFTVHFTREDCWKDSREEKEAGRCAATEEGCEKAGNMHTYVKLECG